TCSANKPSAAVDNGAGQVLAAHAFGLEHGADFPAGVAGVKLVRNVAERGKIIIAFQTVYTVIDGNQPDTALPQNLHDLADFQIVTPQAAHVLYNDGLHPRSEEHTSELQSRFDLVCRLLLEKKKTIIISADRRKRLTRTMICRAKKTVKKRR